MSKMWMCGGALEVIPCSRVGHVYRKKIPYNLGGANSINRKRLVNVWLDEWMTFYYAVNPGKLFYRTHKSNRRNGKYDFRLVGREMRPQLPNCKESELYVRRIVITINVLHS